MDTKMLELDSVELEKALFPLTRKAREEIRAFKEPMHLGGMETLDVQIILGKLKVNQVLCDFHLFYRCTDEDKLQEKVEARLISLY